MASTTSNRQILQSMFEEGAFKSPEFEYELRSEDFVAEIPQTGERLESRDALKTMQESFNEPPNIQLKEIRGEGDIWVVEAVQTYEAGGDFHVCVIVEFSGGKISRETRYYGPPLTKGRT
jgi:hypothetical protein